MIIIRDETLGESYSFVPTHEGYRAAYATIQSIQSMGHKISGDVGKVLSYIF